LFERVSKIAGAVRARCFKITLNIRKKSIERLMAQKNAKKVGISSNATLFCNKIDAKLKKRSFSAPAVFDALSNKKKYWILCCTLAE
jgi:hypothetical protein